MAARKELRAARLAAGKIQVSRTALSFCKFVSTILRHE